MASMPAPAETEQTQTAHEGDERAPSAPAKTTHKERFRASLAWALDEYAATLEKLSR